MKILSLYDGMSCAYLAMLGTGCKPTRYVAYEIDKYAITVSKDNFFDIEHRGEITPRTDFSEFEGFDFVMGGSPCTHWSIAQSPDKRETTASGIGWELFQHYVRAVEQAKPKYFIYENNKSMSKEIRKSIDEAFGFEAVLINSALLSAQQRNRLYWVGKRNEQGGYDKVDVDQPEDRGILLEDIFDGAAALCCATANKSLPLKGQYAKNAAVNAFSGGQKHSATMVAEPICVNGQSGCRHNIRKQPSVHDRIYSDKGKSPAIHTAHKPSVAIPVYKKATFAENFKIVEPIYNYHLHTEEPIISGAEYELSTADGRTEKHKVYEVRDGKITLLIKGEQRTSDIKLADGYYIIRKLTVSECARLQTVPEWYSFDSISKTQAYKCLGNGWTVQIISHLINSCFTHLTKKNINLFNYENN